SGHGKTGVGLSHAQFVQQANAICARLNSQIRVLPAPTNPAKIGPYLNKALPLEEAALTKLEKLSAPPRDKAGYKRFLALARRETNFARTQLLPAVKAPSNSKRLQFALGRLGAMDKRANTLANRIGLTVCGQASSS